MFLLFFLIILIVGLFIAYRLLWPEMYVKLNAPNFSLLWRKPRLRDDVHHENIVVDAPTIDLPLSSIEVSAANEISQEAQIKIEKLEGLLYEKNILIDRLQIHLESERAHRKEFENVKNIMDEEIKHLREQIKAFRNYYKEKADA